MQTVDPNPCASLRTAHAGYGETIRLLRQSVTLLESSVCSHYLMWLAQQMPPVPCETPAALD